MDPLSITASAIALGTLVQATLVSLNSLARDYKAFSKELDTLGAELQSLSLVIKSLEKYIEGKSTLTAPLDDKHLISALNACYPTLKAIKATCKEIRRSASQGSINKLKVGFFWSSTRTELQEMRSSLESHKSTLLLSLQLKSLELHLASTEQKSTVTQIEVIVEPGPKKDSGFLPEYQRREDDWKGREWKDEGWKGGGWKGGGWTEDEKVNESEQWNMEDHSTIEASWSNQKLKNQQWKRDENHSEKRWQQDENGESWKAEEWNNEDFKENGEWKEDETWKQDEAWKEGAGRKDDDRWKDRGGMDGEWKRGSTQLAAIGKFQTETNFDDKDGKCLTKKGGWESVIGNVSTDQVIPWWKKAGNSSAYTEAEGRPWPEPESEYSPPVDKPDGLSRSGVEIKTHQHFGEWRSTFDS